MDFFNEEPIDISSQKNYIYFIIYGETVGLREKEREREREVCKIEGVVSSEVHNIIERPTGCINVLIKRPMLIFMEEAQYDMIEGIAECLAGRCYRT